MPRIHSINSKADRELSKLITIEETFQRKLTSQRAALQLAVEYTFLSGYKIWENFLQQVFVSQSRFNDPVSGKRTFPYLAPKTEAHALGIIKLEKDYLDWTSPDNVIKRAEILFRNHCIITTPLKSSMQDLRDAKKIRNFIAHGGDEAKKPFDGVTQSRLSRKVKTAGEFLLASPSNNATQPHYVVYYLHMFKTLVTLISD